MTDQKKIEIDTRRCRGSRLSARADREERPSDTDRSNPDGEGKISGGPSRLTGITVSVSGNVAGGRVNRVGSGVRDLFQGAYHQHSSRWLAARARDQHLVQARTTRRMHQECRPRGGAETAVEAARRGLGSARLSARDWSLAPSSNAKGSRGRHRHRLAWSPSLEFHLRGSLPSPPINAADRRRRRLFDTHCDARYVTCVDAVPVRASPETNKRNIADTSGG